MGHFLIANGQQHVEGTRRRRDPPLGGWET